jgi:hypothetical protein
MNYIDISTFDSKIVIGVMGFRGINFKHLKTLYNLNNIWWDQDSQKIFIYSDSLQNINAAKSALNEALRIHKESSINNYIDVSVYNVKDVLCIMGFRGINFKNWKSLYNLKNIWWSQESKKIFIYGESPHNVNAAKLAINDALRIYQNMSNSIIKTPGKFAISAKNTLIIA